MMIRLVFLLLMMLTATLVAAQAIQGTAFTYQGSLSQAGTPTQGNVDMTFALFDASSGGNQVGATLEFTAANGNPVAALNGIVDVTLDFGALAFNGATTDQRFLEVSVNGTLLTPRTPIQNAPYALQSQTSELAYTVANGSIGAAQIDASQVQRRVGGTCSSGSSISGVNQDGTVECQAAGAGTITGVTAGSGLSGGGTSGNVTVSADTNFVQQRVTGTCASGSSIRIVAADGTVTCQTNGTGTITGVTAGNGLTGGGSSGNVALAVSAPLSLTSNAVYPAAVFSAADTASTGAGIAITASTAADHGSAVYGEALSTTGGVGVTGVSASPDGLGVFADNTAATGKGEGVHAQSASSTGIAVFAAAFATNGANTGVLGETTSPAGTGVHGRAADTHGALLGDGTGVLGESSGGSGVVGTSASTASNTAGVFGSNSSNGIGVYGQQTGGANGAGVYGVGAYAGVFGTSGQNGVVGNSVSGTGVVGTASNGNSSVGTSGNSPNIGVYGGGYGATAAYGVYGIGTTGVRADSSSTSGFGVYAYASASSGTTRGVYGQSQSANGHGVEGYSGPGVGVYGASSTGHAGYFAGNVVVTGSLSKAAGSFKIDDPLDPANRYLYHSFVESPDMKNIYDGVATLDANGQAWIELPDYFEALNQDFRYQLTALGEPGPSLYVAQEIAGNRFRIAGGSPNQRISWQVTGTRHDAYAEAHRIPVEVNKPDAERGKYLHPELFGQPESKSVAPVMMPAKIRIPPTPELQMVQEPHR